MGAGGTYRINDTSFPVPTTTWEVQVIAPKLNGLPIICSYRTHVWEWPSGGLEACVMEDLLTLFEKQNSDAEALSELETDPPDASTADETYGTVVYTDFVILGVSPVTRGLPHYDRPRVVFEVYVA